jgi:hypothetical protein
MEHATITPQQPNAFLSLFHSLTLIFSTSFSLSLSLPQPLSSVFLVYFGGYCPRIYAR